MREGQEPGSKAGFEDPQAQKLFPIWRFHAEHQGVLFGFHRKVLEGWKNEPRGKEGVGFSRSNLEIVPSVYELGGEVPCPGLSDNEARFRKLVGKAEFFSVKAKEKYRDRQGAQLYSISEQAQKPYNDPRCRFSIRCYNLKRHESLPP